jgi:membrane-bound lytic murein transglycosylase D
LGDYRWVPSAIPHASPIRGAQGIWSLLAGAALLCACASGLGAADAPASPTPAASPAADPGDAYDSAKQLFDTFAPDEVKQEYDFPSREQFEAASSALQAALDGDSLEDLAKHEGDARQALEALRASPQTADYADWLAARLEEAHVAHEIVDAREPTHSKLAPARPESGGGPYVPYYDLWLRRMGPRAQPANAAALMPGLRQAFAAEGVPPELAWLAEIESSLNPDAHSPSGARGLFQLKAAAAKGLGLSTFLPDERTDPEKSAHAAARMLKGLKERFGTWPLAIAAYNAGEGRVGRTLAARGASTYAGIASALPAGTRMYVPEVCALVEVRTGLRLAR